MVLQRKRSRGFKLPHDECFAYCRGDRHADVFWLLRERYAGIELATLAGLCAAYAVRFVAAVPAPEARWTRANTGIDETGAGGWRRESNPVQGDPADYDAWLLTWEEPWPAGLDREGVA